MSAMKRNDPCWCDSGKKYKHCHLDRAEQQPLGRENFEAHTKKSSSICCAQSLNDNLCTKQIVRAHTVSKSGSLKQIALNGHVFGTKPSFSELVKNDGKLSLKKVGINEASTFTGFCSYHDKELFSALEDQPISLSDEQLFLLAYRSINRELYLKKENLRTSDFLKSADRGMGALDQRMVQMMAQTHEFGVNLALAELNGIKSEMDSMLLSKSYSSMNHYVVELTALPKVLVSGSTQPEFDFAGRRLQTFGKPEDPMSHLIYNAISYDNKGCFVFSWLSRHHEVCKRFIDSLSSLKPEQISTALTKYCYTFCENTWASPAWWDSLDDAAKNEISRRVQLGSMIHRHQPNDLVPDEFEFGAFPVGSTSIRYAPAPAVI